MTDMLRTIAPKSNQLNADDLIGGQTRTIKITKVAGVAGEQPIAINYEGDNGKPYMPCKSMRRVLVNVWGDKGNLYVGRSLTLYRDDKVLFGGIAVGGLRISHMSDITVPMTMALTATRANRKPFTVLPLQVSQPSAPQSTAEIEDYISDISLSPNLEGLAHKFKEATKAFTAPEQRERLIKAKDERKAELSKPAEEEVPPPDVPF